MITTSRVRDFCTGVYENAILGCFVKLGTGGESSTGTCFLLTAGEARLCDGYEQLAECEAAHEKFPISTHKGGPLSLVLLNLPNGSLGKRPVEILGPMNPSPSSGPPSTTFLRIGRILQVKPRRRFLSPRK